MDLAYTGHKLVTERGDRIHHIADSRLRTIAFTLEHEGVPSAPIELTVDEARRLATSLLRDVNLIEDGAG